MIQFAEVNSEELKYVENWITHNLCDIIDNFGGICISTKKDNTYVGISIKGTENVEGNTYTINDTYKNTAYIYMKGVNRQNSAIPYITIELVLMTSLQRACQTHKTYDNATEVFKRLEKAFKDVSYVSESTQPDFHEVTTIQINRRVYPQCGNLQTKTSSPC